MRKTKGFLQILESEGSHAHYMVSRGSGDSICEYLTKQENDLFIGGKTSQESKYLRNEWEVENTRKRGTY